jgi:hypothetical protein
MEDAAMYYNPEASEPETGIGRAKAKHEQTLMAIDGVEGVGIGRDGLGNDAIKVYLRDSGVKARLPKDLDGYPVETEVTGIVDAQRR